MDLLFQTSLGIDIGDHSVSFAYLKASLKGIRLAAHGVYPLDGEMPLKEKLDRIGGAIRDFMGKNSMTPATVFLGMPRHAAILRYVQLPLAVKENLRESLGYEMEKYVPLPEDDIYFDCQVVLEDKESGKLTLLLVASRKETVDQYLNLATHVGVGISGIEVSSTATANYFASLEGSDKTDPCAMVCLRDGGLELNCLRGGFLDYSRWVDRAEWGADPTGLIARELEKRKGGVGDDQDPFCVVFCGLDEQPEWVDSFRSDDRLDVRHVDLSRRGLSSPAIITAYGLALKGIRNQRTDINLAPKERRKRPNKAGQYAMVVLAALLILLAVGWGGGSIISQQVYLSRLNGEIARLGVEVKKIEQTRKECKAVEDRIDYLSRLFGAGTPVLDVLKELSLKIPKTAWVISLDLSDGDVKIEGRADASSELIPALDASPLFSNVAFISSIIRGQAGNEMFRIGLKVGK